MSDTNTRVAIITGGTGALGAAVVAELLATSATVYVPYTQAAHFQQLRDSFTPDAQARLHGAQLDLTDEAAVETSYRAFVQQIGRLDTLINIAGGYSGGKPVHETPWSLWQQQLDVNLKTAVLSCRAAIPHMLGQPNGAIVNISSRTALQAGAHVAAYGAAKRGVVGLTEAIAAELRDHAITANAVLPSVIDTPANRASNPNASYAAWIQPREIARVIMFLIGPDARRISGVSIPM